MPNAHNISWTRIAVEAAAIVVSILLAFAIDAWWDDRKEGIEETEILLGLKSEFSRYRDELSEGTEYHVSGRLLVAELISSTRRGTWSSESLSVDEAFVTLTDARTHDFGGGVLDAVISAGRLEIISDYQLRLKLASWGQVFNEIRDDEIRNQFIVENLAMPYMLRWHVPQSRGFEFCCSWSNWPESTRSVEDVPELLSHILADPEFAVLLELKYISLEHTELEYRAALHAMTEIIELLDASLIGKQ